MGGSNTRSWAGVSCCRQQLWVWFLGATSGLQLSPALGNLEGPPTGAAGCRGRALLSSFLPRSIGRDVRWLFWACPFGWRCKMVGSLLWALPWPAPRCSAGGRSHIHVLLLAKPPLRGSHTHAQEPMLSCYPLGLTRKWKFSKSKQPKVDIPK